MKSAVFIILFVLVSMSAQAEEPAKLATAVTKSATALQNYVGKTVGVFLDSEHISFKSIELSDEPPGILRVVRSATPRKNEQIIIWLSRNDATFSREGKWSEEVSRNATIASIKSENK